MPFFSVIIPLFNKAAYIKRTLDSVLSQTFKDFELLVIDDGSTDEGGSIVASYTDNRIRLIHQQNTGESAARNRGIYEAMAEWLAFLDADDEYFSGFLEKMHKAIVEHSTIGFVFCNPLWITTSGITRKMINSRYKHFHLIDNYCDFLHEHRLAGATSSSIVIKKSILQQVGCFPVGITFGGDTDTWMRLGWVAKAGYEPFCLSAYHNEVMGSFWLNSEGSPSKRRRPVYPDLLISTYNDWKRKGIFPEEMETSWRRCIREYILVHVYDLIQYGDKKAAWFTFLKGLRGNSNWKLKIIIIVMLLLPKFAIDKLRIIKRKILAL